MDGADSKQGAGWWLAADDKWYPPELHRDTAPRSAPVAVHGGPGLPAGVSFASPVGRLGASFLESVLVAVTLGIGWLIWALVIGGQGQTPAKQLLKHRVIRVDTVSPAGLGRMLLLRGIVASLVAAFAISITIGILLLMPFWDARNQNLWDKVSSTYVVKDAHDAWGLRR